MGWAQRILPVLTPGIPFSGQSVGPWAELGCWHMGILACVVSSPSHSMGTFTCLSMFSWQWCDWSCMETQGSQEHKSSSFQTLIMSHILSIPKIYSPSTLLEPRVRPILTSCLDWKSRVLSSKSDPGVGGFSSVTSSGSVQYVQILLIWRPENSPHPSKDMTQN